MQSNKDQAQQVFTWFKNYAKELEPKGLSAVFRFVKEYMQKTDMMEEKVPEIYAEFKLIESDNIPKPEKADIDWRYNSYLALSVNEPKKHTAVIDKPERPLNFNDYYKMGYNEAFKNKGSGEPSMQNEVYIGGYKAGVELYKFYNKNGNVPRGT